MLHDSVIVGAGLAGLAYAWQFLKLPINQNKKIVILEQCPGVGGRIASLDFGKKFINLGPSRFNDTHILLQELLQELKIPFREYKQKTVLTLQEPFREQQHGERENKSKIERSYPHLTAKDHQWLAMFQYHPLDLLVHLVNVDDEKKMRETTLKLISLDQYLESMVGSDLLSLLKDASGCEALWHSQVSEGKQIVTEMFSRERRWFSAQKPLSCISDSLMFKLVKEYPTRIEFRIGCAVKDIRYHPEEKKFQLNCLLPSQKICGIFTQKLILAVDLPALHKLFDVKNSNLVDAWSWKEDPRLTLTQFTSFPVLRLFVQFSKPWFDPEKFPVIYSGSRLRVIIPSSLPGMLQFSYTDGKDTEFWLALLQPTDSLLLKTFKITDAKHPMMKVMMQQLTWFFPEAVIPEPEYILGHICQVAYPTPSEQSMFPLGSVPNHFRRPPSDGLNFVVIGEALSCVSDLGVTSAWLESALRSATKGFHHMMGNSQFNVFSTTTITKE